MFLHTSYRDKIFKSDNIDYNKSCVYYDYCKIVYLLCVTPKFSFENVGYT